MDMKEQVNVNPFDDIKKLQISLTLRFPNNQFEVEFGPNKKVQYDSIEVTIDRFTPPGEKKLIISHLQNKLKNEYTYIKRVVFKKRR
jgi:hypothetical protein